MINGKWKAEITIDYRFDETDPKNLSFEKIKENAESGIVATEIQDLLQDMISNGKVHVKQILAEFHKE